LHISISPVIGATTDVTLTTRVRAHPLARVYEMVVVPAASPVTRPVEGSMVATVGAVLDHVPPAVVLLSVNVPSIQIKDPPVIGAGNGFTVRFNRRKQPVGIV
jgi:hypothetical protein